MKIALDVISINIQAYSVRMSVHKTKEKILFLGKIYFSVLLLNIDGCFVFVKIALTAISINF